MTTITPQRVGEPVADETERFVIGSGAGFFGSRYFAARYFEALYFQVIPKVGAIESVDTVRLTGNPVASDTERFSGVVSDGTTERY